METAAVGGKEGDVNDGEFSLGGGVQEMKEREI